MSISIAQAPHLSQIFPFVLKEHEEVDEEIRLRIGHVVAGRWRVDKHIGDGFLGSMYYEVTDLKRPICSFIMKVESNTSVPNGPPKLLPLQHKLFRALKEKNCSHFPGLETAGETTSLKYLITGLVGRNLDDLKNDQPDKRFTLRTCLHIARETLYSLEEIHYVGYTHRDVKPANIFIGRPPVDVKRVYVLNYELCRKYLDDNGVIMLARQKIAFRGSPRYASVKALKEMEQSRADDMWSWLFTLIEISVGKLPWDDCKPPPKTDNYLTWLAHKKQTILDDPPTLLAGCPREFKQLFDHLTTLQFDTLPDYALCLQILNECMIRKQYTENIPLDWEPKPSSFRRNSTSTNDHDS